jgi:hypothetical protein
MIFDLSLHDRDSYRHNTVKSISNFLSPLTICPNEPTQELFCHSRSLCDRMAHPSLSAHIPTLRLTALGHASTRRCKRRSMQMSTTAPVTPERLMQFAWGYAPTLAIEAAIRHRVFDVLDGGPKTLAETATATGASERGLRGIMNVLTGFGFLGRSGEKYTLTPESEAFLVSTKPSFQGGIFKHTSQQLLPKWTTARRSSRALCRTSFR